MGKSLAKKKKVTHKKKQVTKIRTQHKKRKHTKKKRKISSNNKQLIFDFFISIGIMLVLLNIIFFSLFSVKKIPNETMSPVLKEGDTALVKKTSSSLKRFDILMLKVDGEFKVGRIIGLPEESIKYIDDYLYVNDLVVDEKFLVEQVNQTHMKNKLFTSTEMENSQFKIPKIPKEKYLILGDNRPNATDSRFYGLITENEIYGKIKYRLFPIDKLEEF